MGEALVSPEHLSGLFSFQGYAQREKKAVLKRTIIFVKSGNVFSDLFDNPPDDRIGITLRNDSNGSACYKFVNQGFSYLAVQA